MQKAVQNLISLAIGFLIAKGLVPANTPVIVNVQLPSAVSSDPNPVAPAIKK